MTEKRVLGNTDIGGASESAPQICHKKHHRWLARRLAYLGLGIDKEVSFNVWTHSSSFEEAKNDTICRRTRQGFVPVGTFDECLLDPVRRIRRR
jgi:hypothetical protein